MDVLSPGTQVKLAGGAVSGIVIEVLLQSGNRIQYRVEYWNGQQHNNWFDSIVVEKDSDQLEWKIGFK